MPTGEGPTGAIAFGRARGVIEGVLAAAGIPVLFLTPPCWKRAVGICGTDKDRARTDAIRRWPAQAALFARVKVMGAATRLSLHRSYHCRVATRDELVWAHGVLEHHTLADGCHLFELFRINRETTELQGGGTPVKICLECRDHARRADVTWTLLSTSSVG